MHTFHPISLADKPFYDACLAAENSRSSSNSFGNVFLWDLHCLRNVTPLGSRLGLEFLCPNGPFFAFPHGEGELVPALAALRRRAEAEGRPFVLKGVTAAERERLEAACPGGFRFQEDRDNFDYIYSVETMATLSGKKLHGKRNFCNRFEAAWDWHFSSLTPALFDDCRTLLAAWDAERSGGDAEETRAILRVLDNWEALGMLGGILYANKTPVAFSIGEPLTADTVDVHFEKALEGYPGAYPMVAREFARLVRQELPNCLYLNREEDMGLPGLRKAKEEWFPLFLLEKYIAKWNETV